jgi:pantoate kinase
MGERRAVAFSPAGISSFFEICDRNPDGSRIEDISRIGARGGGFGLERGVTTEVKITRSRNTRIKSYINGKITEAQTSRRVAEELLKRLKDKFDLEIRHQVEVPIGSGFGTSAAGAFSCVLALAKVLEIPMTYNEIAVIAHNADIICGTGLGTVEGLTVGGLVLVIEPGAPGIGKTDQIPISPDVKIVAGSFQPIKKETVLLSEEKRTIINRLGQKTMKKILLKPDIENFMRCCRDFAVEIGLMSKRVEDLIGDAAKEGALGATQNMLGEAVHAAAYEEDLKSVTRVFKRHLSDRSIVVSKIDFQGARILPRADTEPI